MTRDATPALARSTAAIWCRLFLRADPVERDEQELWLEPQPTPQPELVG